MKKNNSLGERQEEVYHAILRLGDATNREISEYLEIPINCVTGRVFELRKFGYVIEDEKRKCKYSNKIACVWKIKQPEI